MSELSVGAIDGQNRAVIASSAGRFVVFAPEGDESKHAIMSVDTTIDPGATDLSIVPPNAMVLYGGGEQGLLQGRRKGTLTSSRLDAIQPDGARAWLASVDFLATQPAIDGIDRVYLVGAGLAAIGLDGRKLWFIPSAEKLHATAFADGTLAVRGRK